MFKVLKMPKVARIAIALAALLAVALAVLVTGIDRAIDVTLYDQSLYLTVLFVLYVVGDALWRAVRR